MGQIRLLGLNAILQQYQMFKKCKENGCLNRQMIDFFTRQFSLLKQVARNCKQTSSAITSDQIKQSVQLMEKRIIFVLQQKTNEEYHDYLSDFYEDKLQKIRKQLNKEVSRSKQLQTKIQDLTKQLRNKEDSLLKAKPVDFSTINQNLTLKNELVHSQQLIQQNQLIMEEQNRALQELHAYITHVEQRETQLRMKVNEKIKQLDEAITSKHKQLIALTKEFQKENKKRDKQFREVQLYNISLLEEKDKLQSQITIKSQEIKLLSKKIYDQSLVINKFERAMDQSEGILLEEKIENNRAVDQNKILRDKIKNIQNQYQNKLDSKTKEIKELQFKIISMSNHAKQLEMSCAKNQANMEKANYELKNKIDQIKKLQEEFLLSEAKYKQLEREWRRTEKRERETSALVQQYSQIIQQKDEELQRYKQMAQRMKKDGENHAKSFDREKQIIKSDIETQFQRLVDMNREILASLQNKQKEIINLTNNNQQYLLKIKELNDHLNKVLESFEDAKNKMSKVQQQREDLNYIREQLQIKLKHTERRCQQLQRIQNERENLSKKNIQLEQTYLNSRKLLKEKENELQRYKKIAIQQNSRKGLSQREEIKLLKEEICKKDFQLKQTNAKVSILQDQLRDADRNSQIQKQKMACRIKQMQIIIQERFQLTNRLIDPTVL